MATKTINIDGFNLRSTWTYRGASVNPDTDVMTWYNPTTPSTASKSVTVDLSSIQSGSRVTSATLAIRTNGSGGSTAECNGISVGTTNDHTGANAIDVTSWFSTLGTSASITFKFQAYSAPYTSSSSSGGTTCTVSGIVLTINYELPNSSGTFSVSSVEAGPNSSITLSVSAVNSSYYHTAVWTFGTQSYTQTLPAGTTTSTWSIPMSFCNEIPNAVAGTGSVVLTTYNESGSPVGSAQTYTFTVTVPASVVPTASTLSASPLYTPQAWGVTYVQNFSAARLVLPGVAGAYGSSIASVVFSGGGWSANGVVSGSNYVADTGILTVSGTVDLRAVVTDSRGRTCTRTVNITVTPYSTPRISSATARRCMSNGTPSEVGTYAMVTVNYSFASVGGSNHFSTSSSYQINGTGSWHTGPTSSGVSDTSWTFIIGNDDMGADHTHNISVTVADDTGNYATSTITLPTAMYVLHFLNGGKSIGIGQAASTTQSTLSVSPEWSVYIGGVDVKSTMDGLSTAISGVSSSLSSLVLPISQTTGSIPMDRGGTGATTAQGAASSLNFTQAIPYVNSNGTTVNTITLPQYSGFMGVITSYRKEFRCMIPIGRRINASSVSISGTGYLITNDGKVRGGDGAVEISSMGSINTVISQDGFVGLCITTTDTFGGSNNIPAVLSVESLTLTFS